MGKPLRVLMVEDSEDDVLLTIHTLQNGGYVPVYKRVQDPGAMRKAIGKESWDAILCDYQMPHFNGLEAIALLKETGRDIPLIIVSGAIGEELAVACMRAGAHDYVMKGNLPRLIPAIERELEETKSRYQRTQAEEELKKASRWQEGINLLQQSLLASATLEEKLRSITDRIVSLFGADFCRIWLIQPGDLCEQDCVHAEVNKGQHVCRSRERCLHLLASSGRYTHTNGKMHGRVPFGSYKIGRIASDQDHKFLTNNVQNDPRIHNHDWARELSLISFAGYQLRPPGGKTLGVLALFATHPISSTEDAILDGLSSAIGSDGRLHP